MCAAGQNTGSLDSLVFVTCDNGSPASGQFTDRFVAQYKARHEDQLPDLQCPEHPMNELIKVGDLQKTRHAGSSSCAFQTNASDEPKVESVPLWGLEGSTKEWWRQCWVYTGQIMKKAVQKIYRWTVFGWWYRSNYGRHSPVLHQMHAHNDIRGNRQDL